MDAARERHLDVCRAAGACHDHDVGRLERKEWRAGEHLPECRTQTIDMDQHDMDGRQQRDEPPAADAMDEHHGPRVDERRIGARHPDDSRVETRIVGHSRRLVSVDARIETLCPLRRQSLRQIRQRQVRGVPRHEWRHSLTSVSLLPEVSEHDRSRLIGRSHSRHPPTHGLARLCEPRDRRIDAERGRLLPKHPGMRHIDAGRPQLLANSARKDAALPPI